MDDSTRICKKSLINDTIIKTQGKCEITMTKINTQIIRGWQ